VPDGWADVIISNGVLNLFPDKFAALQEQARALKPGRRLPVGDEWARTPQELICDT
jgi:ubiquinone/menaquinone biosynthesis C-methylase UbiE